jgi:VanZ family protein
MPGLGLPLDKIAHLGLYAGLAMLLAATNHLGGLARQWFMPTLFGWVAAFGAADEATQILFGRTCDLNDWLFDLIGAAGGLVVVSSITRFIERVSSMDPDQLP